MPPAAVKALFRKMLRWPLDRAFPAVDVLRVLLTHPDGGAAVAEEAGAGFVRAQTERVSAARLVPALRPVVLLTARALGNALKTEPVRLLMLAGAGGVLDCASELVHYDSAPVKTAAAVLLHNLAHALLTQTRRGGVPPNPDLVDRLVGLVLEGLVAVPPDAASAEVLLLALGTAASFGPRFAATARDFDLPAAVAAAGRAFPPLAELVADVLLVLQTV